MKKANRVNVKGPRAQKRGAAAFIRDSANRVVICLWSISNAMDAILSITEWSAQ